MAADAAGASVMGVTGLVGLTARVADKDVDVVCAASLVMGVSGLMADILCC